MVKFNVPRVRQQQPAVSAAGPRLFSLTMTIAIPRNANAALLKRLKAAELKLDAIDASDGPRFRRLVRAIEAMERDACGAFPKRRPKGR